VSECGPFATDDVFQECWSRVITHRESYRPEARFATWLYRIAHNCCMDHWRRSGRRNKREAADDEAIEAAADERSAGPLDAALEGEAGERLAAALAQLPQEQRDAFLLYVEGGLSVSECLAKGKPMLLVSPIPGQEERNADYLLEWGAAVKAVDPATLEFKFGRLLGDPQRLRAMGEAARRIGRPNAAAEVLALISAAP